MTDLWIEEANEQEHPRPAYDHGGCESCGRYRDMRTDDPTRPYCWSCDHGEPQEFRRAEYTVADHVAVAVIAAYAGIGSREQMRGCAGADTEALLWRLYDRCPPDATPQYAEAVAGLLWPAALHEDEMSALAARMED